jgi:hypothetical protein
MSFGLDGYNNMQGVIDVNSPRINSRHVTRLNGLCSILQTLRKEQVGFAGFQEIQSSWLMAGNTDLLGFIASTMKMHRASLVPVSRCPTKSERSLSPLHVQARTVCRRTCKATAVNTSVTIRCQTW